jgi:hypothetical protein
MFWSEQLNGVVLPNGVVQFPADQNQFPHPAEAIPLDPMIEEVVIVSDGFLLMFTFITYIHFVRALCRLLWVSALLRRT